MDDYEATVRLMFAGQKGQSVTSFLHELYNLATKTGINFNETDFVKIAITKLNHSNRILLAGSNSWAELLDKAHESEKLILEQRHKLMQSLVTKPNFQFMTKKQNFKRSKKLLGKRRCHYCGKYGHIIEKCRHRINDERKKLDKELDDYI